MRVLRTEVNDISKEIGVIQDILTVHSRMRVLRTEVKDMRKEMWVLQGLLM